MNLFHLIILILHILGAALIIGTAFYSVVAVMKPNFSKTELGIILFLNRYTGALIGTQFVTGVILMATDWDALKSNPLPWVKLGLFLINGVVAKVLIESKVKELTSKDSIQQETVAKLKTGALISLLIFVTIAILGIILVETT